jgi:YegS/Rv2252/BmrU family lipid kinase
MTTSSGSVAMIVNPKSGYGGRKLLWRGLHRYLIDHQYEVKLDFTTSLGHAAELAHQADLDPRCGRVVVAGGDGTVREAAHGMAGSTKPFLILPCGTENLLASELGLDAKLQATIQTFERGFTRPLDLGVINGQCFICIAGFGFDGEVVGRVHRRRKGHIDYYDYLDPLWQTFWSYRFWPFRVHADGEEIFHGRGLVFVGNISRYALGLHLLQNADYGDGLLDVCVFRCSHQIHLLKHSLMTLLKRHTQCKDVVYRRCRQAVVEAGTAKAVCEVDGDPGPSLPVQVSVIPAALQVMVPEKGRPAGLRRSFLHHLFR